MATKWVVGEMGRSAYVVNIRVQIWPDPYDLTLHDVSCHHIEGLVAAVFAGGSIRDVTYRDDRLEMDIVLQDHPPQYLQLLLVGHTESLG